MGFRTELGGQRGRLVELGATTAAGGVLCAVLLLALPSDVFDAAVPWCLLFASAILAAQSRQSAWLRRRPAAPGRAEHRSVGLHASLFVAGTYGSYFGGGLGVVLLGVPGLFLADHLHTVTGLNTVLANVVAEIGRESFRDRGGQER